MRQRDARERRLILLLCSTADRRRAHEDEIAFLAGRVDGQCLVALLTRMRLLVLIGRRLRELELARIPELDRELDASNALARRWGVATELASLQVLGRLESAGIRAMPVKGSILARRLHDDVAVRSSIDIDVLVAPTDLSDAVAAVAELGWQWKSDIAGVGGLPLLHETLVHHSLPRVELHWRVHWYERQFAADALARAFQPEPGVPLEMQPLDGLVALMLFYARDGFAGLRFPADVAAWWDSRFADDDGPFPVAFVEQRYPALLAPVSVASNLLSELVGVPAGDNREAPFRWRVAAGLANPFIEGGREQAEANAGLTDLLLAPQGAAGDAMRRVLRNAPSESVREAASMSAGWGASAGHLTRVAGRWSRAFVPAVLRSYALGPSAR